MNQTADARLRPAEKLALHYQFSDYLRGKDIVPIGIEVSPCGVCNATCDFCFYAGTDGPGQHRKVFLERDVTLALLAECAELEVSAVTWTGGGEPSLHPDFGHFVYFAHLCGREQGLFTNALAEPRYDPALLSWIRVTVTDRPLRPEYIKMLRLTRTLGIAFNYAGPQDDELLWHALHVAEDVEADYVQVRPALAFHGQTVNIKPPAIDHPLLHVTDYKFREAGKKHGYRECEGYHFVPFVWEDGNVDVCSYMRLHEGYTLGNIYRENLQTILERAPHSIPVHEQCQVCCKLHEINTAIHEARQLRDVNFP